MGTLDSHLRLINVFLPFQRENSVNLKVICEILWVVTPHDNPEGTRTGDLKGYNL